MADERTLPLLGRTTVEDGRRLYHEYDDDPAQLDTSLVGPTFSDVEAQQGRLRSEQDHHDNSRASFAVGRPVCK